VFLAVFDKVKQMLASNKPMLASMDGGHIKRDEGKKEGITSECMIIYEENTGMDWEHKRPIPILIRIGNGLGAPKGNSTTDLNCQTTTKNGRQKQQQ
jgi:hypothetical protein